MKILLPWPRAHGRQSRGLVQPQAIAVKRFQWARRRPKPVSAGFRSLGERLRQLEKTAPHMRIGDPVISAYELERLALHHRIMLASFRRLLGRRRFAPGNPRQILEEERNRHIKDP